MRGGGTKLQITRNSPASAHLIDVTRTVSRSGQKPTGIDRIERAYIAHLVACDTDLFGVLRTKLGYLLLDRAGCRDLLTHCERPVWTDADLMSRLTRRKDAARGVTEAGLRRHALDRATPARLRQMLQRHLPEGTVYFNIGHSNFNDRQIHAVKACDRARIAVYVHDTIPLDWPDTQTPNARLRFRRFLDRVEASADIVLCNSEHTKSRILAHTSGLDAAQVHVLTPGLPEMVPGAAPNGPWTGKPYFTAIGTIEPRKNIGFLLDLWEGFQGPDAPHLVICGRRGWLNKDVFARLDEAPANVHELNDLADAALWRLLSDSNGLLFPSLAEGFGYPAFEAAHLGVPVVSAPLPVLKEQLGNCAIYAEPSERYVWNNKIEQLAQRRRGQSGEQEMTGGFVSPTWQVHFNRLFTLL